MNAVFFTDSSLMGAILPDAGIILLGILLFLFGVILVLSLLLNSHPQLYRALTGGIIGLIFVLLCIVAIDLSGVRTLFVLDEFAKLSELLSSHRYLLIQLPFILLTTAVILLLVYGEKLADKHAVIYKQSVAFSLWFSFASIILIALESMV